MARLPFIGWFASQNQHMPAVKLGSSQPTSTPQNSHRQTPSRAAPGDDKGVLWCGDTSTLEIGRQKPTPPHPDRPKTFPVYDLSDLSAPGWPPSRLRTHTAAILCCGCVGRLEHAVGINVCT